MRYEDYDSKISARNIRLAPFIALVTYFVVAVIDSIVNEVMPEKVHISPSFRLRQSDVALCIYAVEAIVYVYFMFAFCVFLNRMLGLFRTLHVYRVVIIFSLGFLPGFCSSVRKLLEIPEAHPCTLVGE